MATIEMIKKVNYIPCPKGWGMTNEWDSYRPLLFLVVTMLNPVSVSEFGCGEGSTKLLLRWCKQNGSHFWSYETNRSWANNFKGVTVMKDYDDIHLSEFPYMQGVLFIDSSPGKQRKELIAKHANHADVMVVHDTEPESNHVYGMAEVLSTFKYRLDYAPKEGPHTTAVSNFINVADWLP